MTEEIVQDLSAFDEDNAKWKARGKRVPWKERRDMVAEHFPEAWTVDAHHMLMDNATFWKLWEDLLAVGQSYPDDDGPGKMGRRGALDETAGDDWLALAGLQYSEREFSFTFRALARARRQSISMATAAIRAHDPDRVGLSRSRVYRLMMEGSTPTLDEMSLVAKAYGKRPEYFTEYRVEAIVAALAAALEKSAPETSLHIYKKLVS